MEQLWIYLTMISFLSYDLFPTNTPLTFLFSQDINAQRWFQISVVHANISIAVEDLNGNGGHWRDMCWGRVGWRVVVDGGGGWDAGGGGSDSSTFSEDISIKWFFLLLV